MEAHIPSDTQRHPLRILFLITALWTLVGTPLAVWTVRQARSDWHAVPVEAVIVKAEYRHSPAGHRAKAWRVRWDAQCDPGGLGRVSLDAPNGYVNEPAAAAAVRADKGRRVRIWHTPGEDGSIRGEPPAWEQSLPGAVGSCLMAAVGWLGVAAFAQLGWRRLGHRLTHTAKD